jgi:hypothetical protein
MHTVLTQKAELPIERWLGFFVGGNEAQNEIGNLLKSYAIVFKTHFCPAFSKYLKQGFYETFITTAPQFICFRMYRIYSISLFGDLKGG